MLVMLIKLKIFMRKIKFVNAAYYHVYNRGVEKRKIFLNQSDYQRFLDSILVFNSIEPFASSFFNKSNRRGEARRNDELVKIVAFCLMPNHFHLLLKQENNNGISKYCINYLPVTLCISISVTIGQAYYFKAFLKVSLLMMIRICCIYRAIFISIHWRYWGLIAQTKTRLINR